MKRFIRERSSIVGRSDLIKCDMTRNSLQRKISFQVAKNATELFSFLYLFFFSQTDEKKNEERTLGTDQGRSSRYQILETL